MNLIQQIKHRIEIKEVKKAALIAAFKDVTQLVE
jgi:hypothetical protein